MRTNVEVVSAARTLVAKMGEKAPLFAAVRARDWQTAGEVEASALWREIVDWTRALLAETKGGRPSAGAAETALDGRSEPAPTSAGSAVRRKG